MTSDEALEVLGYLLGHEKAVDSGEMEDGQNRLNSQEQEALKVVLSEFRELKKKATPKKPIPYENTGIIECPHCYTDISDSKTKWCCICGQHLDWSEGKDDADEN